MTYEFEIIMSKWHHNRGNFFFARHLGEVHDFDIPDDSLFGDILVSFYREMYPLKDADGNPRWNVFVFRTFTVKRLDNYFTDGQNFTLTTK